jgi:repressor LexA
LVVALIEGHEATLKRFYRETHRARLEPANARYAPIYAEDCHIEAVVVGLVRRM